MTKKLSHIEAAKLFQEALVAYDNNNYKLAFSIYERLAVDDIPEAQYNLAVMYDNGEGVEKNNNKAMELYKLAAYQEYLPAAYNLGMMYVLGQGVSRDLKKGIYWLMKAASENDPAALYNIGNAYHEGGHGIDKDDRKALEFWQLAANQGHTGAKSNIRKLQNSNKKLKPYIPDISINLINIESTLNILSGYLENDEKDGMNNNIMGINNFVMGMGIMNMMLDNQLPILAKQYTLTGNNYIKSFMLEFKKMYLEFEKMYTQEFSVLNIKKSITKCKQIIPKILNYEKNARKNMQKEVASESDKLKHIQMEIKQLIIQVNQLQEQKNIIETEIRGLQNRKSNNEINSINQEISNMNFKITKIEKAIKYKKIDKPKGLKQLVDLESKKNNLIIKMEYLKENLLKNNQQLIVELESKKNNIHIEIELLKERIQMKKQDTNYFLPEQLSLVDQILGSNMFQ